MDRHSARPGRRLKRFGILGKSNFPPDLPAVLAFLSHLLICAPILPGDSIICKEDSFGMTQNCVFCEPIWFGREIGKLMDTGRK
jgi:hypothetical protein